MWVPNNSGIEITIVCLTRTVINCIGCFFFQNSKESYQFTKTVLDKKLMQVDYVSACFPFVKHETTIALFKTSESGVE